MISHKQKQLVFFKRHTKRTNTLHSIVINLIYIASEERGEKRASVFNMFEKRLLSNGLVKTQQVAVELL